MTKIKDCRNCEEPILNPGHHSQVYCLQMKSKECPICEEDFEYKCNTKIKTFCSKSCTSKHIRKPDVENLRKCEVCGDDFAPRIGAAMYCCRRKSGECRECGGGFEYICAAGHKTFCKPSCRQTYTRRENYVMRAIDCGICKKRINPVHAKQLYCPSHEVNCEVCLEEFSIGTQEWFDPKRGRFCDNVCSTIDQGGRKVKNVLEYKNMDEWAVRFKQENGRKPGSFDRLAYFGVSPISMKADRTLHASTRGSNLEAIVKQYLEELGYETVCNTYPLRDSEGRRRQIDLLVKNISIAIEVQDFMSHSRTSDEELFGHGGFKNGPKYHKAKRALAEAAGFVYVEIWEDSIISGEYKEIVDSAVAEAMAKL